MEKLKICFCDLWPEFDVENIFLPILKKYYDVEINTSNPDIIIHSIYGGFKETPKYKCKKILFLGENYRPQNYGSDFSISFDPHTDKNYQLPLWQFYLILRPESKEKLFQPRILPEKYDRFASFVVSNPSNFWRNGFYNQFTLQSFGKVHSYGRYLTNDNSLIKESQGKYWRDAKNAFFEKNKHKYSIAFENNSYPYYNTEKIMDAFLGFSIPLYWGDPKIQDNWNSKAFINVLKVGQQKTIELVRKMEKDNQLFLDMFNEPVFTEEQKKRHIENIEQFESWFIDKIKK
jgi:hypothetical protein